MTLEGERPLRRPPSMDEMGQATISYLKVRGEDVTCLGYSGYHDFTKFETKITYAATFKRPGHDMTFSDSGSFIHPWP